MEYADDHPRSSKKKPLELGDDYLEQELYRILTKSYGWLFTNGKCDGYWKDVSDTSLVALCLTKREPDTSPWLEHLRDWLLDQQIEEGDEEGSWEEEIWGTATALIALSKLGVPTNHPKMITGLNFVHKLFNTTGRSNWEDEPWETSWAILAIAQTNCKKYLEDAYRGLEWLMSLQDESGRIIAPHYTAYFIKITYSLNKRQLIPEKDLEKYQTTVEKATKYLIDNMKPDILWTGMPWSNGQILWALASTYNFPFEDRSAVGHVIEWFSKNQEPGGNWYDAEDTSSAILGLFFLLRGCKIYNLKERSDIADIDTVIYERLRRMLSTPKCSFGKKFIETTEDGTTRINLTPKMVRTATIAFALASGITVFIALYDWLKPYLSP
ncbi:MAG: terpene cyclase/mutase family protein [Methanomassiliicoccales archaeon]|nr:terpene cyclase/mutase family protein [Methanomassiliicoccales archaeon]